MRRLGPEDLLFWLLVVTFCAVGGLFIGAIISHYLFGV